jgi:hypothetical protein
VGRWGEDPPGEEPATLPSSLSTSWGAGLIVNRNFKVFVQNTLKFALRFLIFLLSLYSLQVLVVKGKKNVPTTSDAG